MVWELSVGDCEKRNQAKFRARTCFYVWLFLERHEGGKWKCCWSLPSGQPRNHCTFGVCVFAHQVLPLGRNLLICRPWPLFSLLRGTSFGNPARGGFSIFWVSLPHPVCWASLCPHSAACPHEAELLETGLGSPGPSFQLCPPPGPCSGGVSWKGLRLGNLPTLLRGLPGPQLLRL